MSKRRATCERRRTETGEAIKYAIGRVMLVRAGFLAHFWPLKLESMRQ